MPYYLSKVLPLLVMPVFIALCASLLALFLLVRRKRKSAIICLLISILVLWLASLPIVADQLLWSLERQHLPRPIEEIPAGDCIVVLGGALGAMGYPRVEIELTDAADRVYQAAKLFQSGKGRTIIVSAGNQPWAQDRVAEAILIRALLIEWGVTEAAIVLDTSARNTRENAILGAALIRKSDCQSNLLVTSAWHMPRALASFKKVGVTMFPVPADVRSVRVSDAGMFRFLPRANALATTSHMLHEWLGVWVYRWKGWN